MDNGPHIHLHYEGDFKLYEELRHQRDTINELKEIIMATQAELAVTLGDLIAKVTKIGGETQSLLLKIDELAAAVVAAGNLTPEVEAALAALQVQVDVVDALVADPAVEEPVA